MKLCGTEYGKVFCAPGALNFHGQGYPFHRLWKYAGMTWEGIRFVSKTATAYPNPGNMPLQGDGVTPQEFLPRCIIAKMLSGHILNAVGLSGPGIADLLQKNLWQQWPEPFQISFMPISGDSQDRIQETSHFVDELTRHLPSFRSPFAVQINFGCPNTGHDLAALHAEINEHLDILSDLDVPIVANFSVTADPEPILSTARHPAVKALWIANTIPWGTAGIDWQGLFGSGTSPLTKRGFSSPGGLSGPVCLPFAIEKVNLLRNVLGPNIPIVAGNGIQHPSDVRKLVDVGASAVAIGSVAIVRPWRMKSIIAAAHQYLP